MERWTYRHVIALNLMLLIFFSTIGVNLVTTFCSGCQDEHVSITYTAQADEACSCCGEHDGQNSCCTSETACMATHHESEGHYEYLKANTTEQKNDAQHDVNLAVITLLFKVLNNELTELECSTSQLEIHSPIPISGRTILALVCTLII